MSPAASFANRTVSFSSMAHFLTFLSKFMVETKLISPELWSQEKQLSLDIS